MPNINRGRNEVGAAWIKQGNNGEYISLALDLDALLELTGGATGKIDLKAYPIEAEKLNPRSPDYRLKYYPRLDPGDAPRVTRAPAEPLLDDDLELDPRPNTPGVIDPDMGDIPGTVTHRRRRARDE